MTAESDARKIEARLMHGVGARVTFTYPAAEGVREGRIKDRVVVPSRLQRGVQYYDVVDLIDFDGEPEPFIRITYYRHLPDGRLIFAGQTSICEPMSVWKRLLAKAREKDWFPVERQAPSGPAVPVPPGSEPVIRLSEHRPL